MFWAFVSGADCIGQATHVVSHMARKLTPRLAYVMFAVLACGTVINCVGAYTYLNGGHVPFTGERKTKFLIDESN